MATRTLAVAVALLLVLALVIAYRPSIGGGNEASASAELVLLREQVSPLLVYSEFGHWADTIWAADPDDPANRAYVATVEHSPGFGISASLSPDGTYLAYTTLPRGASRDDAAELWLLEVGTVTASRLAEEVDLRSTPVWTPASDAVVVRQTVGDEGAIVLVDLSGQPTRLSAADTGLYPIEFSSDGTTLYYATLSEDGTDIRAVSALGGESELLAHLSDGFARDWHLAPDGSKLAYLAQTSGASLSYHAEVLDIATGEAQGTVAGMSGSQFNPIWDPHGGLTIGSAPDGASAGAAMRIAGSEGSALAGPETGFDVPVSWSPDGAYLVVRNFEGASASDPGQSHVIIINQSDQRQQLSALSDVLVAGWLD